LHNCWRGLWYFWNLILRLGLCVRYRSNLRYSSPFIWQSCAYISCVNYWWTYNWLYLFIIILTFIWIVLTIANTLSLLFINLHSNLWWCLNSHKGVIKLWHFFNFLIFIFLANSFHQLFSIFSRRLNLSCRWLYSLDIK
jgi:hypothetical protein